MLGIFRNALSFGELAMPTWLDKLFKRKSSQELEDTHLEAFFTDVEDLQRLFQDLVTASSLRRRILVIHGIGGVGKSTLLRMFRLFCKRQSIPVGLIGAEEIKSTVDVMTSLAVDLAQDGVILTEFSSTFQRYRAIQGKVERKAKETDSKAFKLGKAASKGIVETAASIIPVVGPLVAALAGMGTEAFVDWLRGFLSKPEIDLYLDPVKPLTDDFLADVAKAAARRRLVLMLDTYERMDALDEWMRDWVKALHSNVLVVIAGRTFPGASWERAWPSWMAQAQVEELDPLIEDDLSTLVRRYYKMIRDEDPEPAQVEAVVRFARGLPLVATTAARLWASYGVKEFQAVKAQVVADLVDRLLEGVPGSLGRVVEAAATLRWFDRSVLRAMLDLDDAQYKELRRFPFVRPVMMGKLAVHDVIREIIDENIKTQDPECYQMWHERAAAYFETKMPDAGEDEWKHIAIELVYHKLRADIDGGAKLLLDLVRNAILFYKMDFCAQLFIEGEAIRIAQPYEGELVYLRASWLLFQNRWEEAEGLYNSLLEQPSIGEEFKLKIFLDLGRIYHYRKTVQEGIQLYKETLGAARKLGNTEFESRALALLAHSCIRVGRLDETFQYCSERLTLPEISRDTVTDGDIHRLLGEVYTVWGDLDNALYHFGKSLELLTQASNRGVTYTLRTLAELYQIKQEWQEAEEYFKQSLESAREFGDMYGEGRTLRKWAEFYLQRERLDKAEEFYRQGLEIAEELKHDYGKVEVFVGLSSVDMRKGSASAHDYLYKAERLALAHQFWDRLAQISFLQCIERLNKIRTIDSVQKSELTAIVLCFFDTLKNSLRYNHYLLDSNLKQIIELIIDPEMGVGSESAKFVLMSLAEYWESEELDDEPLTLVEQRNRKQEIGLGKPQLEVLRRISAAIEALEGS